jgi:NodT family efflux transporter outer membrane factor (OMF) lipoprotein
MNDLRYSTTPRLRTASRRGVHLCVRAAAGSAALAGVLAVGGCKVGPDYQPPEAALNEAWQAQTGSGAAAAANARWWEGFNDPTMSALVSSALSQNLNLRVAGLRVIEARAARGIAVGRFFPQVQQAVGSIGGTQASANGAPSGGDRSYAEASIGLDAAWELDFWGKFRRGIEAADAEVLLSVADYDAVLVSLAGDVATNYVLVRSLQERLEFARANAMLQDETLSLTQTRFKAGAVSELDVATARATLANTRALIPDLENGLRQTKLALCLLLGRTPSDLENELAPAAGGSAVVPVAPSVIATGVPAELLRRRPDVRAAERIAAAQSARIGEAVADLYPRISITGATGFVSSTYNGERHPDLGNLFDANSFAGFIGLQVNWPILNYGRIRGNIRVQDARYEEAVASYQQTVLSAAADVESGLSDFLRSKDRTAQLTEAVDASNRSVELSLIQYRAGAVDFIRVNTAQTALVQEQDTLVSARAAIALGAVRTYRALGGGWEVRGANEFVDPETAQRMRDRTNWGDVLQDGWHQGKDLGFPRPAMDAAPAPAPTPDSK